MKILFLAIAIGVAARAVWNFSQGHLFDGIAQSILAGALVAVVVYAERRPSP